MESVWLRNLRTKQKASVTLKIYSSYESGIEKLSCRLCVIYLMQEASLDMVSITRRH